jgi:hypothetical protein
MPRSKRRRACVAGAKARRAAAPKRARTRPTPLPEVLVHRILSFVPHKWRVHPLNVRDVWQRYPERLCFVVPLPTFVIWLPHSIPVTRYKFADCRKKFARQRAAREAGAPPPCPMWGCLRREIVAGTAVAHVRRTARGSARARAHFANTLVDHALQWDGMHGGTGLLAPLSRAVTLTSNEYGSWARAWLEGSSHHLLAKECVQDARTARASRRHMRAELTNSMLCAIPVRQQHSVILSLCTRQHHPRRSGPQFTHLTALEWVLHCRQAHCDGVVGRGIRRDMWHPDSDSSLMMNIVHVAIVCDEPRLVPILKRLERLVHITWYSIRARIAFMFPSRVNETMRLIMTTTSAFNGVDTMGECFGTVVYLNHSTVDTLEHNTTGVWEVFNSMMEEEAKEETRPGTDWRVTLAVVHRKFFEHAARNLITMSQFRHAHRAADEPAVDHVSNAVRWCMNCTMDIDPATLPAVNFRRYMCDICTRVLEEEEAQAS